MKKRRVMLDGLISGVALQGDVSLRTSEVAKLRKIILASGGKEIAGETGVVVTRNGYSMLISLRAYNNRKDKVFLNISGNPLKFLKGASAYGYVEADRIIITAYRKALEMLEGTVPARILEAVAARDINLHSLEFATYTCALPNKQKLLNDWAHMYSSAYSSDGEVHTTLASMLDLEFQRKHKSHTSLPLRIKSKDGKEDEAMMLVYDKAAEMRSRNLKVSSDIEDRLRLDLNLNYGWFRRRAVSGRKLRTLADLSAYVEKNHGTWIAFVAAEYEWALKRTCLFYMWTFDALKPEGNGNKRLNSKVHDAMLKTRAFLPVSDAEWIELINKGRIRKTFDLNPHKEKLCLDMSEL